MKKPLKQVSVHGAFSVPFVTFKFSKHTEYDFKPIEKSVRKPDEWHMPLNTSYPNIEDDDPYIKPNVRDRLKRDLQEDLVDVMKDLGIMPLFKMKDFWYNIYHDNQGQEVHDHLSDCTSKNPTWSVIYYYRNAPGTVFIRNDDWYRTQEFPMWRNSMLAECYMPSYIPDLTDGDVIMFPPYIKHMVRYSDNPDFRLTFATNLTLLDDNEMPSIDKNIGRIKGFG